LTKKLSFKLLDNNDTEYKPVTDFISLFEKLDSKIFYDLSPKMGDSKQKENVLFSQTRGQYGVLNISKLYDLYLSNSKYFSTYIEPSANQ
jgi:hypothetical protein